MDEALTEPTPIRTTEPDDTGPEVEIRGLGFALSAAAVGALLDPERRADAEITVDLSALSIRVPAGAIGELLARLAPGVDARLASDQVTLRLAGAPAVRLTTPPAGVQVRIDGDGLRIGDGGSTGQD